MKTIALLALLFPFYLASQTIIPQKFIRDKNLLGTARTTTIIGRAITYPRVLISGAGSASGNADSTLAKSTKVMAIFEPNDICEVHVSYNIGQRKDTINKNNEPSTEILLFPDNNWYGFIIGTSYVMGCWHSSDAQIPNRVMQYSLRFCAEYNFQRRGYSIKDSSSITSASFNSHTWNIGPKFSIEYLNNNNIIGLDISAGYYLLDISNNTNNEFRTVYSLSNNQYPTVMPSAFQGIFTQINFRLNKVGLYYRYAELRGAHSSSVYSGLTHGQHFVGLTIIADLAEF